MKITLQHHQGSPWFISPDNRVMAKGLFFDPEGHLIQGQKLTEYFNVIDKTLLAQRVKTANGIFSVIVKTGDNEYTLACDRIRFFPLFYSTHAISDRASNISSTINPQIIPIFLATGFTPQNHTLLEKVYQVQAGEIVTINGSSVDSFFYHTYTAEKFPAISYQEAKEQLSFQFEKTIQRLIKQLDIRQVVLSLSGGFDSRYLLAGLKQNGYTNVVCFSFGRNPNPEQKISEKVAKTLGYPWHFIEHTPQICQNYLQEKLFQDYYHFSANHTASFFLMYFFALRYLKQNHLIDDNAVFLTGYSGDLLGGSQLFPAMQKADMDYFSQYLYGKMYSLKRLPQTLKEQEISRLKQMLAQRPFTNYTVAEDILLKEKVVKLVINSANIFCYFGHQTLFPLFDHDLMDFCVQLPFEYRLFKKLYNHVLKENYFIPMGIYFEQELQPTPTEVHIQIWKEKLKNHLPYLIRKRFINKNDIMNYQLFTRDMIREMKSVDYSGHNYNSIVAQWYVYKLQNP